VVVSGNLPKPPTAVQPVLRRDRQAVDAQTRSKTSINDLLRA
jgi:tetrahydrodipicolinate N-succinyltransferase